MEVSKISKEQTQSVKELIGHDVKYFDFYINEEGLFCCKQKGVQPARYCFNIVLEPLSNSDDRKQVKFILDYFLKEIKRRESDEYLYKKMKCMLNRKAKNKITKTDL